MALAMEIDPGPQGAHSLVGKKTYIRKELYCKVSKERPLWEARAKKLILRLMSCL